MWIGCKGGEQAHPIRQPGRAEHRGGDHTVPRAHGWVSCSPAGQEDWGSTLRCWEMLESRTRLAGEWVFCSIRNEETEMK